jgi:serine protease Do
LVATLLFVASAATLFHFDLIGHFAYALEKGRLRATAEELAQVEQTDRVIGMVAEMVRPAVVSIVTKQKVEIDEDEALRREQLFKQLPDELRRHFERMPTPQPRQGVGSGVIIDAENGYILTNNHVVEGADKISVHLRDHREREAELLGADPLTDLAVIQIKPDRLHALELGDSDAMFVGSTVLAIGAPFQLEQTVTKGIISARGRSVRIVHYADFIQTDAAINPGNSGGPLVNLRGEVIGINTAIATGGMSQGNIGVGFSIPSNRVKELLPKLIDGKPIVRGYAGISIGDLAYEPELAERLGLEDVRGVLIHQVLPGDPADRAGLEPYDVVLTYEGEPLESSAELSSRVALTEPGTTVKLTIWRDGKEKTVSLTVAETPDGFFARSPGRRPDRSSGRRSPVAAEVGITVEALTKSTAEEHGWDPDEDQGVVITEVDAGSEAQAKGIRVGDLIKQVDRKKVTNMHDFNRLMRGQSLEKGIMLYISSHDRDGKVTGRVVFLHVE